MKTFLVGKSVTILAIAFLIGRAADAHPPTSAPTKVPNDKAAAEESASGPTAAAESIRPTPAPAQGSGHGPGAGRGFGQRRGSGFGQGPGLGRGPGQGRGPGLGRGPGFGGGRGFGQTPNSDAAEQDTPADDADHAHDDRHDEDRDDFHFLLSHHDRIRRTVTKLPNGVDTLTESADEAVAAKIKEHVYWMQERIEKAQPIRMRDPLFAELFRHTDKIVMKHEETAEGVRVIETSDDLYVANLIQAHAAVVSKFVARGFEEARLNHEVPAPRGKGEQNRPTAPATAEPIRSKL
ncbi:MAG: hypothetical protein EA381_19615 [Planctomycetaceae bacterium]|nr:MAG: hypothetical protein EA381_19615 [Planctomycetaceae bacterium]